MLFNYNMTEALEIYLNSKFADQYLSGVSDTIYNLPNIIIQKDETAYVTVKDAVIPNSFYNVNETNNILNLTIDGISYSISLQYGNYNVTTLKNELMTEIGNLNTQHGHDGDVTITYLVKTNKFYFFHSHHSFSFLSTSTCFEILGFEEGRTYLSTPVPFQTQKHQLTSTISINLFTIRNIYIESPNVILNNINSINHNNNNMLCAIPIKGTPNSIIFYEDLTKHLIHNLNNLTTLRIQLKDQDGELINFNGCHYSLTLEITIIKKLII